jgi:HSP20 family protein
MLQVKRRERTEVDRSKRIGERSSSNLTSLRNDIDNLFSLFFRGFDLPLGRPIWPALNIAEEENSVIVKAEIPGCKAEDIDISVHGNMMTISGERKETKQKKEKGYYHVESAMGEFRREFMLPCEVDAEKVNAAYKDGVLTVTLPKQESSKAIKIKVKSQ